MSDGCFQLPRYEDEHADPYADYWPTTRRALPTHAWLSLPYQRLAIEGHDLADVLHVAGLLLHRPAQPLTIVDVHPVPRSTSCVYFVRDTSREYALEVFTP
jgi:hypothetical protein